MHDNRNAVLAGMLGVVALWGLAAWVVIPGWWPEVRVSLLAHRIAPVAVSPVLVVWLWCEAAFGGGGERRG